MFQQTLKSILMDKLSKELKGKPVEKTLNKIATDFKIPNTD